jgi:hypothetical protein
MQSEEDSREQDDLIAKEAESDQTSENEDDENDNY